MEILVERTDCCYANAIEVSLCKVSSSLLNCMAVLQNLPNDGGIEAMNHAKCKKSSFIDMSSVILSHESHCISIACFCSIFLASAVTKLLCGN